MAYAAKDDALFEDGFFVEDSDVRCWNELAESLKQIATAEAAAGNKAFNIIAWHDQTPRRICVQFHGPARWNLSELPEGVTLSKDVYEGEMYALVDTVTGHQLSFDDPTWKEEDLGA